MNRLSWLQKVYWTRFGKPLQERCLFKQLVEHPISSVLEIGVGDGQRMRRIAKLVQLSSGCDTLRYIGIDEFESAGDGRRHLSLKQAHQLVSQQRFKASLIPGDHRAAIPRVAHKMGASDLIIIDGGLNPEEPHSGLIGTWLNRLAHDESTVLACEETGGEMVVVDTARLELPQRLAA